MVVLRYFSIWLLIQITVLMKKGQSPSTRREGVSGSGG